MGREHRRGHGGLNELSTLGWQNGVMTFLTDFADQAVVLPVVAVVALVLAANGWWRGAAAWLGMIGVTFGAVLALKLGFLACRPVFGPWSIHSPSGHTAAAAAVAGGLAVLLSRRPAAALPASLLAAALIGLSRVVLGFHSVPEVILGGATGVAGAVAFARLAGPPRPGRRLPLLTGAVMAAVLLHGWRLPAEAAIWDASHGMLDFVPACRTGAAAGPM